MVIFRLHMSHYSQTDCTLHLSRFHLWNSKNFSAVQLSMKREKLFSSYVQTYFVLLYFIMLHRYCVFLLVVCFYKLKVCSNPALLKSTGTIFSTAFAHFVSVCHIFWDSHSISKHVKAKDYESIEGSDDVYYFLAITYF